MNLRPTWLRHDWRLYTRHDAARFEKPAPYDRKAAERRAREAQAAAAAQAEQEEFQQDLLRLRGEIAWLKFTFALRNLGRKYSQSQPRVPAGNPDGGQWTSGGTGRNDPVRSGARHAMGRRVTVQRFIDGRLVEVDPGLAARLDGAENQAQSALRRVREIDPAWRPEPSIVEPHGIFGAIDRAEAEAREARERLGVLDRLGIDPPGARPNAEIRSTADILAPGGNLVGVREGGASGNIRTVSPEEFVQLRDGLLAGTSPVPTPRTYNGLWLDRPDGMRFGLRLSEDHGPTIDVGESLYPDIPQNLKVHER